MIRATHEIHERRKGRNIGVGLLLMAFVFIVLGLTVVKVTQGFSLEGYDHVVRPSITTPDTSAGAGQ